MAAPGDIRLADDVADDGVLVEERYPVHHLVRGAAPEDGLRLSREQDCVVHLNARQCALCTP